MTYITEVMATEMHYSVLRKVGDLLHFLARNEHYKYLNNRARFPDKKSDGRNACDCREEHKSPANHMENLRLFCFYGSVAHSNHQKGMSL